MFKKILNYFVLINFEEYIYDRIFLPKIYSLYCYVIFFIVVLKMLEVLARIIEKKYL